MELVLRYLENAARLKNLAAAEQDPKLRADLEKQAAAYAKLAAERATDRNLPFPGNPPE